MTHHNSLLEWAYHWERTDPQRLFVTQPLGGSADNVRRWTFGEVMHESRRMAAYLQGLGLPARSQIAICSKNCSYWVMADLAIWMAGHVSVPIFPTLTAETTGYILEHSESKLLFVGKLDPVWEIMKKGVPDGLPMVAFPLAPENNYIQWDEVVATHEPLQDPVDRDPEEMATIIYTSGSTGRPKGVMHNFATMLACTEGIRKVFGAHGSDRYLSYLPLAHGMERWLGECVPLRTGLQLFYADSLDTFVEDLQRARPTLFASVPRLWSKFQLGVFKKMPPEKLDRMLKIPILGSIVKKKVLKGLGLDAVRFAGSGSAPVPGELIAWYRALGLELLEGYGMTENFNYSHMTMPGHSRPGYVGNTYDDVECRIAEDGEIQIKGPGSMMGYFKMPEETKEVFTEDGWLRTGDRGQLDSENRLMITGRTKEIFKTSKGKYVSPAPIENAITNHPRVDLACVIGAGQPQPHAVVTLSEDARAEATAGSREAIIRELDQHLQAVNAKLETYERLQFLSIVNDEWLPESGFLTPTMKIKRTRIEEVYGKQVGDWYARNQTIVWSD